MNKKKAAEFLGVSERAIERYTAKGKLPVHYEKKKNGGQIAFYDDETIKKLKAEQEEPPKVKPAPKPDEPTEPTPRTSLVRVAAPDLAEVFSLAFKAQRESDRLTVAITEKLTLTIPEAAALSGISQRCLKEAIKTNQLVGCRLGRLWRIKRSELEEYIKKL